MSLLRSPVAHITLLTLLMIVASRQGRADQATPTSEQATPTSEQPAPTSEQLEFFEKKVRPLLATHCYACHSNTAKKVQAGLLVDSRAALLRGGDSGEAIVPGDADGSLLIEAVRYESYEMPPQGKLAPAEIATLERWVTMGAPWPPEDPPATSATRPEFDLAQRKSDHWVWQPIQSPKAPAVMDEAWPRAALDRFVLATLEAAGLEPAPDAERSAIMRRLYFDLIGLPPSPAQAESFLSDRSPRALERLVSELLDSPHFGERWGRHWLDLVRYAESRGHEFDNDAPNAYQYRDYIIRALNADVPYDQFVREHIAGDLLTTPRLHPTEGYNESVLGTGFWFLGEWVHSPVDIRKDEADRFDNMLDVMSKTFLGVTVACARCHDHKFDAISTADYYSLSGFLQSSDYRQVRFETLEHHRQLAEQLENVDAKYQQKISTLVAQHGLTVPQSEPLGEQLAAAVAVDYESVTPDQFLQDGYIFGSQPRQSGQPWFEMSDDEPTLRFATRTAAVSDPFWDGLTTPPGNGPQNRSKLAQLPRSGRTLRTPTFTLTHGDVACRVQGEGHVVACVDSHRLIAGPLHGETIKPIKPANTWVSMNLSRYVGHRIHLEFTPAQGSQLAVSCVLQGATKQLRQQFEAREAAHSSAVAQYADLAQKAITEDAGTLLEAWAAERSDLQKRLKPRSKLAIAMIDGTGEDDRVLVRGNASKPGDVVPRHFLTAVTGSQPMSIESGSGRRELADQINAISNPLTARVIVNRIWHYLMGRGIVPTTDDFGVLGQRPTNPELLDHLATTFVKEGHSIKQMIRYIALSRTYQMSSRADRVAVTVDPKNQLWHHRPPKRLEGEVIRDALLMLAGNLNLELYGEPVPIHLTSFMDGRGRPAKSGPLDGAGRRSIYVAVRRNFLSPFMLTFDTPAPFSTMGRRNVSNVPSQALILMNDPFVVQQAEKWGSRAIQQSETMDSRVTWMYQTAFARPPTDQEQAIAVAFLNAEAAVREVASDDAKLWSDFAHALINTKEFIFLR